MVHGRALLEFLGLQVRISVKLNAQFGDVNANVRQRQQ